MSQTQVIQNHAGSFRGKYTIMDATYHTSEAILKPQSDGSNARVELYGEQLQVILGRPDSKSPGVRSERQIFTVERNDIGRFMEGLGAESVRDLVGLSLTAQVNYMPGCITSVTIPSPAISKAEAEIPRHTREKTGRLQPVL